MTEEQIKNNAVDYAEEHKQTLINPGPDGYLTTDFDNLVDAYVEGAHSMYQHIKDLAERRNPWVSVEDYLPKKSETLYLGDNEWDIIVVCKTILGSYYTAYLDSEGNLRSLETYGQIYTKVVQWMPIQ